MQGMIVVDTETLEDLINDILFALIAREDLEAHFNEYKEYRFKEDTPEDEIVKALEPLIRDSVREALNNYIKMLMDLNQGDIVDSILRTLKEEIRFLTY